MNHFNLIDDGWIPVVVKGNKSLKEVFSNTEMSFLGGTPTQKIAVLNLLIAIAQAAATPQDMRQWVAMGPDGLGRKCVDYLDRWHDAFWLYGDKPFLQMPACAKAALKPYGAAMPQVASGNTTVLTHQQVEPIMTDASRALLLVEQMGFALAGGKTDNSVSLTKGHKKGSRSAAGPFLSYNGLIHTFLLGDSILETVWLNLLTREYIENCGYWPNGVGTAPWEKMPEGEDCPTARALKLTLMGSLVPLSRFCLLREEGFHYTDGIVHPTYLEGGIIPSMSLKVENKKVQVWWADPKISPSRNIISLLGFLKDDESGYRCPFIQEGIQRLIESDLDYRFTIWHGGISISWISGNNFMSGDDDYIESADMEFFSAKILKESLPTLEKGLNGLQKIEQLLYASTLAYSKSMRCSSETERAENAVTELRHETNSMMKSLAKYCQITDSSLKKSKLNKLFGEITQLGQRLYDQLPHTSGRQFESWAKCRPVVGHLSDLDKIK